MKSRLTLSALAIALPALFSIGCVSDSAVANYRAQYRVAQEQILDLQAQLEDKDRQIELLRGAKNPNADLQAQLADALADRAALEAAVAKLKDQLSRAGTTPIPVELADELARLAEANPDLMSYNEKTGAIRFRSDVTFGSGKAELREQAAPIVERLAQVLSSPVASQYEVRVVGHTDNVPIKNAFVKQQFGDNWGLSTARAVAVMKGFRSAGIPESRMSVAGYGEFRPVEPNGPRGSEANRRVEIYLVAMPGDEAEAEAAPAAEAAPSNTLAPADTVVPMKSPKPADEGPELYK
ncbi:OmpA/MotB family protein [Algisphaera agarilytica]|uniref:Chemotaxis protein MotB n=1 Tax=Algisphaera agarilytica TaxID=1385975 RepID=A0A7X0LM03_9BACT|nr:OmpA family protein [Algisphaera agarilytica]MBB6431552.1 chemotaxis protein MotB [Algisphaera agarilytica]